MQCVTLFWPSLSLPDGFCTIRPSDHSFCGQFLLNCTASHVQTGTLELQGCSGKRFVEFQCFLPQTEYSVFSSLFPVLIIYTPGDDLDIWRPDSDINNTRLSQICLEAMLAGRTLNRNCQMCVRRGSANPRHLPSTSNLKGRRRRRTGQAAKF